MVSMQQLRQRSRTGSNNNIYNYGNWNANHIPGAVCIFLLLLRYIYLLATVEDNASDLRATSILSIDSSSGGYAARDLVQNTNIQQSSGSSAPVVGYAVSFVQCSSKQTQTTSGGLTDASLILRHSIHLQSIRTPGSGSRYDYKMYALVHPQAVECSQLLGEVGFEVIVVKPPIKQDEIKGDFLRRTIHKEWCCGADEFIKLHAYDQIPHDVVVHVDIDVAFYKPLDPLFDALLHDKHSEIGQLARRQLLLERPDEYNNLPDDIQAFITRDWPQVHPKKFPPGYQAGFLVAKRDPTIVKELVEIVWEGNYVEGWGWKTGWGGMGYGGFIGAMAMQGLVAYYYDHVQPNTAVELNQCRYNHMGMDVRYNKDHKPRFGKKNQCRNNNPQDECEDCRTTSMNDIYSVHYTQCHKPWQCQAHGGPKARNPDVEDGNPGAVLDTEQVYLEHCLMVVRQSHALRLDFENKLFAATQDASVLREGTNGTYRPDVFLGHCSQDGAAGYLTQGDLSTDPRNVSMKKETKLSTRCTI